MPLAGPIGVFPSVSQTTVNCPSNQAHLLVEVIFPPGPIAPGFISPSVVQLPTKYLSRWCSGPGLGGVGSCAKLNAVPNSETAAHTVSHSTLFFIDVPLRCRCSMVSPYKSSRTRTVAPPGRGATEKANREDCGSSPRNASLKNAPLKVPRDIPTSVSDGK